MSSASATVPLRGYRIRFYPNVEQRRQIDQCFGAARWIYNAGLDGISLSWRWYERRESWVSVSRALTEIKRDPEYAWLHEVPRTVLTQSLRDLDAAFQAFFSKRGRYPRFKGRHGRQSVRFVIDHRYVSNVAAWSQGELMLPKLGRCKLRGRALPKKMPKLVTVSRDPAGRYFVSFAVESEIVLLPPRAKAVGINPGLRDVIVTSDGDKSGNPRHLKRRERRLKLAQRRLSRCAKGSNRRRRQRLRVARLHARIADARADWLHKGSHALVRDHGVIGMQDRDTKGLLRISPSPVAKAITDASWWELRRQLEYKSEWHGREFVLVDRLAPVSKTCSCCGVVVESMPPKIREWTCVDCGAEHDRAVNAARNILQTVGRGTPEPARAMRGEGGNSRKPAGHAAGGRRPVNREPWQPDRACLEQARDG